MGHAIVRGSAVAAASAEGGQVALHGFGGGDTEVPVDGQGPQPVVPGQVQIAGHPVNFAKALVCARYLATVPDIDGDGKRISMQRAGLLHRPTCPQSVSQTVQRVHLARRVSDLPEEGKSPPVMLDRPYQLALPLICKTKVIQRVGFTRLATYLPEEG